MYPIFLDAVLKSEDGDLLEYGSVCIPPEGNTVDFKNQFVPLLKLETPVQVTLLLNGVESFCFKGLVYLSSGKLLRITSISDELLTKARKIFTANVCLHTKIALYEYKPFFSFYHAPKISGTIYYLSEDIIKILSIEQIDVGQKLMINLTAPFIFKQVTAEVTEKNRFSSLATSYLCKVINMSSSAVKHLQDYLDELSEKEIKIEDAQF
ncbi:hypothetical protein EDD70_1193 [Hydrogenoanaerobacterium saccharovorans]|uniref:Uncharacterized protein n=1 Tax=Hydrogenoanaerobacterium saccharovorans TaxID=474960 RepID=A0A1H7ZWI9_9FIRM|nr:hypothetical protein [Hydrogenoanaerobacterium saccharovorans]RPF48377.1 hypothetical protein EDD70_1193 [Hydrogenoanaerobacterium saccharovorans]SEM61948.1 hypothetical protein SAMN05216180_0898 [Hydrogenoanaerobacterium saccharovorans]